MTGERLNSKLEAEGAEFLVLAHLLLEKIPAHKAYTGYPGYDLVAHNDAGDRTCRIQVKSRWATDFDGGFPIKNADGCDFVVLVALNRGIRYRKRATEEERRPKPPEMWVLPVKVVKRAREAETARLAERGTVDRYNKVFPKKDIPDLDRYASAFELIAEYLEGGPAAARKG